MLQFLIPDIQVMFRWRIHNTRFSPLGPHQIEHPNQHAAMVGRHIAEVHRTVAKVSQIKQMCIRDRSYTVWKWLFKPVLGTFALFGLLGVCLHYVTVGPRRPQPEPPSKESANGDRS